MSTYTPPDSPCLTASASADPRIGSIIANRFELVDVLGVGAYGTVYRASDLVTGQSYAVKALNKTGLDARQQRFQDREIDLHHLASSHPNVLSLHNIIASKDCTYVLLEYCPEGDLFAKITEQGHYVRDDYAARTVFLQLLRAVQHCHSQDIYHRDLKPENIMVTDHGCSVKLADFGLATKDKISQDFGCGSTFYMSPECQEPNPRPAAWYRSAPNDVWSLGVVLINLTCGRNPWKRASLSDSTYKAFRKNPNFLKTILPISDELNHVLQRIFDVDPVKRITLTQLITAMERIHRLTVSDEPVTPPYTPEHTPVYNAICDTPPYSPGHIQPASNLCNDPMDTIVDTEIVPSLQLPSPRFIDPRPVAFDTTGNVPCHLPPSPPPSNRGSVDFSLYTSQPGPQLKPEYLVDPTYNYYYYNADVYQWNACAAMQCFPPQWAHQQYAAHYPAVY